MTLIGDEFRKSEAEQERDAGETHTGRSLFHRPLVSLLLIGAIIIGLLGAGAFLIYIALSPEKEPSIAAEPPPTAAPQEPPPPVAAAPETETAPALPANPPHETAEASAPPAPPAASEPPAALENYMRSMQVAGIRVSDTEKRAIINGRMYAIGDKLPITFELRLVAVAPGRLEFRDANGVVYRKHF